MAKTNANMTSVGWSFKILGADISAMFATIASDGAFSIRKIIDGMDRLTKESTNFYIKHQKLFSAIWKGLTVATVWNYFEHKGKDTGEAPPPISFMKQLPASSWERMGLVLGGGGLSPAQQTAHNTKELVHEVKKLNSYVARSGGAPTFNLQNAP